MRRLLNWFRRGKLEGEFERELSYHIEAVPATSCDPDLLRAWQGAAPPSNPAV
jgi:hypothetical protein